LLDINVAIQWWLGDLSKDFENNKKVLADLDLETETRFDNEIKDYLSKNPSGIGHGFDHHQRVRTFTTIIGVVNGLDRESIQICRYGALLHDISKEVGKGGKGPHNWNKLRKLTRDLMERAKIENRYTPRVIDVIEEHHEDDPSNRSEIGNVLYEGDTADITHLPRCFTVAESLSSMYPTMDRIIDDYNHYQVNPSTPITSPGKRMFKVGKKWAIPTLYKLKDKLGDSNMKPYFPFLGFKWRENMNEAPEILRPTLETFEKTIPNYEISLYFMFCRS